MKIEMTPIGVFHTREKNIPRHWSISDVVGTIEIDQIYAPSFAGYFSRSEDCGAV
jgi:hypothetical protein